MINNPSARDGDVRKSEVVAKRLSDDGTFPNNERLPALIYRDAFVFSGDDPAATIERVFLRNGWGGSWRNGIYDYHHYHSTAHEVLGVAAGTARVQLGGDGGAEFEVQAGDAIVIPAGVAHKNLGSTSDFLVVGAYPAGQEWDMMYGRADERPRADRNIEQTPLPEADPIFGAKGPLIAKWD
jgi:uncharacterized protein YjlB